MAALAEIKPFRALRYDERQAGPLEDLIAPPYDVITPEERELYLAKSPHNVVHLTLPGRTPTQVGSSENGASGPGPGRGRVLGAVPGLRRSRRGRANTDGPGRVAAGRALRDGDRAAARAHAPRAEGGASPHPARGRRPTRADLPSPRRQAADSTSPSGRRTSRSRAPDSGGSARRLRSRGFRRSPTRSPTVTIGTRPLLPTTRRLGLRPAGTPSSSFWSTIPAWRSSPRTESSARGRLRLWAANAGWRMRSLEASSLPRDRAAVVVYGEGRTELALDGDGELDVRLVDRLSHEVDLHARLAKAVRAVDRPGGGRRADAADSHRGRVRGSQARRDDAAEEHLLLPEALSGLLIHPREP